MSNDMYGTEDDILWEEGDNADNISSEEKSGGSIDFAFVLIKCVNANVLVMVFAYLNSVMFI
jgi:hypothetical protein